MAENVKTQTAVIGLPMTETFVISDPNAPLILSFEPIYSSLAFGRNGAAASLIYTQIGNVVLIQNLQIGDEIRVNYKPMGAIDWSGGNDENLLLIYQTAKL